MGLEGDATLSAYRQAARSARVNFYDAAARWIGFLRDEAPVQAALEEIAESLGAELLALSRVSRDSTCADHLAIYDRSSSQSQLAPLDQSFARPLLGSYCDRIKPGTVWSKSMMNEDVDPSLVAFHERRKFAELVIIPLETNTEWMDFLEIHWPGNLQFHHHATLNLAADFLTRTWRRRARRIAVERVFHLRAHAAETLELTPLLSADNPARLSRAEYRVCLLLSCGKTIDKAREELGVTRATLRTHLKNVYAKTNTSCYSELLCRLLPLGSAGGATSEGRMAG